MRRLNRLGIRAKITLCVVGITLLLGLAGAMITREMLTTTLREGLEERGLGIAASLEARSVDYILRGNFFELHDLIQEVRSEGKDVAYVFVEDPKGNVIDHTFAAGFPTDLVGLRPPEPGMEYRVQPLQTEQGIIRDIAVPVFDGRAGTLHVGMAETSLNAAVARVVRDLMIATGAALLIGAALAWFFAYLVSRPILRLVRVAELVGRGDLSRRASIASQDEVGRLGKAFDDMTVQLAARIDDLEATNLQLSALNSIATLINTAEPPDKMLNRILERLLDLVQADGGGVLFPGKDGRPGYWVHMGFSPAYVEGVAGLVVNGNDKETGHIMDRAELPPTEYNSVNPRLLPWLEKEGIQAFVSEPFGAEGDIRGALHVGRRDERPFAPIERKLLSNAATQTGIVLANRQLLRQTSQAEAIAQLNQMKSEFVARASHQLRTPATAIAGYVETLLRPDMTMDADEQRQLLADMEEVSDRLNRLIQDILNVTRIASGALVIRKDRVALSPLMRRVVRRLGRQSTRHRLAAELDENLGDVLADTDRLEDVLENLVSNAFKYSPDGGVVRVKASMGSPSEQRPPIGAGGDYEPSVRPAQFVTVSVADEGIGIPAKEVPKLFQRFYQVSGKRSLRSAGIGMGLFICKNYVESMGGEIWVESAEGKGSTFSFTIPVAGSSQQAAPKKNRARATARESR